MAEMKTLNGLEIVDAKARQDISDLKTEVDEKLQLYVDEMAEILGGDA